MIFKTFEIKIHVFFNLSLIKLGCLVGIGLATKQIAFKPLTVDSLNKTL